MTQIKAKKAKKIFKTVNVPSGSNIIDRFKSDGIKFDLETTNLTTVLKTEDTKYILCDSIADKQTLGFCKQVKNDAKKSRAEIGDERRIRYFQAGNVPIGIMSNVIEIDVNEAYWRLAYKLGVISNEVYEKGKKGGPIQKGSRLIALGSLATVKVCSHFDGFFEHYERTEYDPKTRQHFLDVCLNMDLLMLELADLLKDGFVFFWFDAIFVKREFEQAVNDFFNSNDLGCKTLDTGCVNIKKKYGNVYAYVTEIEKRHKNKTDIKIKPFCIAKENPTENNKRKKKNLKTNSKN